MLEIRDAGGRIRTDLSREAVALGIRQGEPGLVAGTLGALELRWGKGPVARMAFQPASDGRYRVTHIDSGGRELIAIADGDPDEKVRIGTADQGQEWPGDHFIEPYVARMVAESFMLDGELDPSVEWLPSTAHP